MKPANKKTTPKYEWLTPDQFGELVQLTGRTIIDLIKKGKIRSMKLGREYRIHISFLEQFKQLATLPKPSSVASVEKAADEDDSQPPKTTQKDT